MIPGKKYDPGTFTSRRPTPEKFEHLRKWIAVDEKFVDITNITELKNVNIQLEQSSKLYVSNVISRVIAQLLGAHGDGFVTLEGTSDGRLKVDVRGGLPTVLNKAINISGAATHQIVALVPGEKIKITNIMFTVSDDTRVTFCSNEDPISGEMFFGGTDEPRGMVHSFGDHPLETVSGQAFKIKLAPGVDCDGYLTYYTEQ
ncbi:hypothetical protein ES703_70754 [subsurface metagenome]